MSSMSITLFHYLVIAHIVTGSVGLLTLWIPIFARKGGVLHRYWGRIFAYALLATGCIAIGISVCTLIEPLGTHPFPETNVLAGDIAVIRALFGWMMLYLAVMTINLAWYGLQCIRHRQAHHRHRNALTLFAQFATFIAAANCAWQGIAVGQPLMVGIAVVGLAAAILNTRFVLTDVPPAREWLIQHTRGLVGAGISVYTAFLAFGAVNLLPAAAFNPLLWATPTALGVSYLLYHQWRIVRARRPLSARATV